MNPMTLIPCCCACGESLPARRMVKIPIPDDLGGGHVFAIPMHEPGVREDISRRREVLTFIQENKDRPMRQRLWRMRAFYRLCRWAKRPRPAWAAIRFVLPRSLANRLT